MEEFFLKRRNIRFEMWQLGLLLIFVIISIVLFGALVERAASNKRNTGLLSGTALKIARIPADSRHFVDEILSGQHPELVTTQRFEGEAGFHFVDQTGHEGDLLLLSRFDGDAGRSIVELVDLDSGSVIHKYAPDIREIRAHLMNVETTLEGVRDPGIDISRDVRPSLYGMYHPIIDHDGGLISQDFYTPLVKIDACSEIVWTIYGAFHHAIERDSDGNYWTGGRMMPPTLEQTTEDFQEDTIIKFSPDGEILLEKSIAHILSENDLQYLIYTGNDYQTDPFHLNDVQPILADGPYWQRGDVFISLRNRSAILLYRPTTNEVLWVKQGPWIMQHDVDIISDHEISIFNNNSTMGVHYMRVLGSNDTIIYNFENEVLSAPYREGFQRHEIATVNQGLSEILPNGDIFVEETRSGRLLVMDTNGDLKWSYVNRAQDGNVYNVHWSRYIPVDAALAIKEQINQGLGCSR